MCDNELTRLVFPSDVVSSSSLCARDCQFLFQLIRIDDIIPCVFKFFYSYTCACANAIQIARLQFCNFNNCESNTSFVFICISNKFNFQRHLLQVGQCLPQVCTSDDVRAILNADAAVVKFNDIYINDTEVGARRNGIRVINVRRVPGEYALTRDPAFYLTL